MGNYKYLFFFSAIALLLYIIWYFMQDYRHLSEDNKRKLSSPDEPGSWDRMDKGFLTILNKVAKKMWQKAGKQIQFESGYRTSVHNEKVGGVENSSHTFKGGATGADIDLDNLTLQEQKLLANLLTSFGVNRFGMRSGSMHVDIADKINPEIWKPYSVWDYGEQIPFNPLLV